MLHALEHALLETAKLLPFLYVTYLAMEYLEHRLEGRAGLLVRRAGRFGPLCGGLLGVVPQCGFSAAAANLYAGRVITLGTLLAIFLSTSDEMLPLLISHRVPAGRILAILSIKAALGVAAGFAVDLIWRGKAPAGNEAFGRSGCADRCECRRGRMFLNALRHTASIALFVALFSFLIHMAFHVLGEDVLAQALLRRPALSVAAAGLIGLIPNCASSIALTTLYLDGLLGFGAAMAGLLVNAGVGLLVLFRTNRSLRENLAILGVLYGIGVVCGGLLELLQITV